MLKADLHTHTKYSDGNFSPHQLIDLAVKCGLSVISITDHDNVNGLTEARDYGKKKGIQVIPGVEISADLNGQEIHILGYFVDHENTKFREFLASLRQNRIVRNEKIVKKLNDLGSTIQFESIMGKVGSDTSIGRPHIAMELNDEGFVKNYYEAFIKYIGDGKPAFIKKPNPSSADVIKVINEVGGLSFIAHPGKTVRNEILIELINNGLDGIEVIHPSHSRDDIKYFSSVAAEHFLLTSGGSDFHGGIKNDQKNFGNFYVSMNEIINMKRRLFS
ncbi:MAG TPA: PHP domain-containing protein [Ignavibacteria bacterium]|nr:PHP domain-containing protein [Ignavibacteria bacterium]